MQLKYHNTNIEYLFLFMWGLGYYNTFKKLDLDCKKKQKIYGIEEHQEQFFIRNLFSPFL
jgi:hypothetical protein